METVTVKTFHSRTFWKPGLFLGVIVLAGAVGCQKAKTPKNDNSTAAVASATSTSGNGSCAPGLDIAPSAPVAKLGDQVITCAELYDKDKGDIERAQSQYEEQLHDIHEQMLNQLIDDKLIEQKAKAAKQSKDDYVAANVKADEPTDAQMKQLYDQAVKSGQKLPPFDQVKGQIGNFLKSRNKQTKMVAFKKEIRAGAKVQMLLPPYLPPKQEVSADGPAKGPKDAPVTMVEFSDFECPFCGRAEPTVEQVLKKYGDKIHFVYMNFPLPMHSHAPKAAEAALCAQDQGKYWEMHKKLFDNQRALEVTDLKKYAADLGLDSAKFDECLDSDAHKADIAASQTAGKKVGVSGTPAFFINGREISGAKPMSRFEELIDYELAQTKK